MKCDSTNCILTFVLGVLAVFGVIFALQTIIYTHEFRLLTVQAAMDNSTLQQAQALANDVGIYNQKNPSPELAKLLQSIQAKPVSAK